MVDESLAGAGRGGPVAGSLTGPGRRRDPGGGGGGRDGGRGWPRSRPLLWAEFLGLYLAIPLVIAVWLPPGRMFAALFAMTALGLVLLWRTPGFSWRRLATEGWGGVRAAPVLALVAATLAVSVAVLWATGGALFALPRARPGLWVAILVLYPLLSALPQELIFRPLFFRRYGRLIPGERAAILANAAVFAVAHLMYWSWIVAAMTFAGGLVFAWAYEVRRSLPLAVVLHAAAGGALFTAGMGAYFYSGSVVRPF
ncbi:CPBP family intramembrane glutamic endopeptidase [Frigidibacter sp. MR17.24]|uniref:CPBP family intramembrane glutamic endopeptidase n=1 Tax=Frigidibacter sp. MR17.24 TaxID=3127345 RepID=UPI003012D28A